MMQHFLVRIVRIRTFRPRRIDQCFNQTTFTWPVCTCGCLLEDVQTDACNKQLWSESDIRMKWTCSNGLICGVMRPDGYFSLPAEHDRSSISREEDATHTELNIPPRESLRSGRSLVKGLLHFQMKMCPSFSCPRRKCKLESCQLHFFRHLNRDVGWSVSF